MSVFAFHTPRTVQPTAPTPGAGPAANRDLAADFAALARVILGTTPVAPVQVAPVEEVLAPVVQITQVKQVATPVAPATRGAILRELAFLDD